MDSDMRMLNAMMSQMGVNPQNAGAVLAHMGLDPSAIAALRSMMAGNLGPQSNAPPPLLSRDDIAPEEQAARYKAWYKEDSKILPGPIPSVPRAMLITRQLQARSEQEEQERSQKSEGKYQVLSTISGSPKHFSTKTLHDLAPITFSQMQVRKIHLGYYLLCRTVTPCVQKVAVQTVIEDVNGTAMDISIYNFPTTANTLLSTLDLLFPKGTIFAIREPFSKMGTQGSNALIRIDAPTDIIFATPTSQILRHVTVWKTEPRLTKDLFSANSIDAWKAKGNVYFQNSQWLPAAFAYSRGLELDPDAVALRANRAEAYLRLKFYSGALYDARRVFSTATAPQTLRNKALWRVARAEYARGEYDVAEQHFTEWLTSHPGDYEGTTWVTRSRQRITESSTGNYDWLQLLKVSQSNINLDVADYQGPIRVKQFDSYGGGRGVVASRDIEIGELLLVSKPFVFVSEQQLRPYVHMTSFDMVSLRMKRRTQSVLASYTAEAIYGNLDMHDMVFSLFAGSDHTPPPSTYPPLLPKEIIEVDPLHPPVNIDIGRLEAICVFNQFGPSPIRPENLDVTANEAKPDMAALYLLPSLFNHSCGANANWHCIGDVMVIRATQEIKAGAEITVSYTGDPSYLRRCETLKSFMIMECGCWACQEDRSDGEDALHHRDQLFRDHFTSGSSSESLAQIRSLKQKLSSTYSRTHGPMRPAMSGVHVRLAMKLHSVGSHEEAIKEFKAALISLGLVLKRRDHTIIPQSTGARRSRRGKSKAKNRNTGGSQSTTVADDLPVETTYLPAILPYELSTNIMIIIAHSYLAMGRVADTQMWLRSAQWVVKAAVGGDKDLFLWLKRPLLEFHHLWEFANSGDML